MWLLKNPMSYDVLVAPNLYGDIISDLSAQMVGGLGFGCSGNIGLKLGVFEPSHGSAPKYAGQNKVNPIATILAAKMMLDFLGETGEGRPARGRRREGHRRGEGPHLRHGRLGHHARAGRGGRPGALTCPVARVVLHEVGPRDGLQVEKTVVPTETKLRWIGALCEAGLDVVQVGSFVHPEKVPQMADTDELFRRLTAPGAERKGHAALLRPRPEREGARPRPRLRRRDGLPRRLGLRDAQPEEHRHGDGRGDGADRRDGEEGGRGGPQGPGLGPVGLRLRLRGATSPRRGSSTSPAPTSTPGLLTIALADTAGHAYPEQVERLYGKLLALHPGIEAACHLHDTYGAGMANIYAALRAGAVSLESSFAGLGGCPFTKVAAGNVATEDLVHTLQRDGKRTDVDLGRLIEVARDVAAFFGREMPGRVHRTGPAPQLRKQETPA